MCSGQIKEELSKLKVKMPKLPEKSLARTLKSDYIEKKQVRTVLFSFCSRVFLLNARSVGGCSVSVEVMFFGSVWFHPLIDSRRIAGRAFVLQTTACDCFLLSFFQDELEEYLIELMQIPQVRK